VIASVFVCALSHSADDVVLLRVAQGPVICQFKMKMWEIPVRFRLNRNKVS
jgi:hypothetical protein